MIDGPIGLAIEMARIFDQLNIAYVLGGSVASSFMGEPRTTVDVDFAIKLRADALASVLGVVEAEFYVPVEAAKVAIATASAFNLIHLGTGLKVDLFVVGDGVLDRRQLERRVKVVVQDAPRIDLWVTSAEDQILRKLAWHRAGGMVSDRQWRDILGLIAVQGESLDFVYLRTTAAEVELTENLEIAFGDSGLA